MTNPDLAHAFNALDYYVEGREDFPCPVCNAAEYHSNECSRCGGTVCLDCGYCPDCHEDKIFCQLPEYYYQRICQNCHQLMKWGEIAAFEGTLSRALIFVHPDCLIKAEAAQEGQAYQEEEEFARFLLEE